MDSKNLSPILFIFLNFCLITSLSIVSTKVKSEDIKIKISLSGDGNSLVLDPTAEEVKVGPNDKVLWFTEDHNLTFIIDNKKNSEKVFRQPPPPTLGISVFGVVRDNRPFLLKKTFNYNVLWFKTGDSTMHTLDPKIAIYPGEGFTQWIIGIIVLLVAGIWTVRKFTNRGSFRKTQGS